MNIFMVDRCPVMAAMCLVDRHISKMCVESAQLLSTAHRILDGKEQRIQYTKDGKVRTKKEWYLNVCNDLLYTATHANHPSSVWTRQSRENYSWLYRHFLALGEEYTHRYGKQHMSIDKLGLVLATPPSNLSATEMTTMPSCMADEFIISDDPILNYRNYYTAGKANLHRWTNRLPPQWMNGTVVEVSDNVYTIER